MYCSLVGTYPFNSFLSGFISTVGSFILGVALRIQTNPANAVEFGATPTLAHAGSGTGGAGSAGTGGAGGGGRAEGAREGGGAAGGILPERAFADFLFAHLILHLAGFNFIG